MVPISLQQARRCLGKTSLETDEEVMTILRLINHWAEFTYQTIDNKYLLAHNGQKEKYEK